MPGADAVLTAGGIVKSFGRRHVLRGVSLDLRAGDIVGVTGENGAGKSTLLKIIVGRLKPDQGEVRVRGRIGYCPQEPLVFDDLTVDENIRYFAAAYRLSPAATAEAAQRLATRFRFAQYRGAGVAQLSGGTRQKLNLAIALLHDPDVLVLDEPYSGFDWETYLEFWRVAAELKQAGRTILVVSHFVHDRQQFDRLHELVDGQFRDGS